MEAWRTKKEGETKPTRSLYMVVRATLKSAEGLRRLSGPFGFQQKRELRRMYAMAPNMSYGGIERRDREGGPEMPLALLAA